MALVVPPGGAESAPGPRVVRLTPRPAVVSALSLSVVIVNYCQWQNTARLTRQLRRSDAIRREAAEVLIVDNRSAAHPVARRLNRLPNVSVYRAARNEGFARAANRGADLARGEWVLLLNPDVTVSDNFLDEVLAAAQRLTLDNPRLGVVGFQLRNRDGSRQASAGPFPTLANTLIGLLLPRSQRRCRHQSETKTTLVPWVTGGCLLVRQDCFRQLGGLDERFFLYYEDVDFCRRAQANGWAVVYEPQVAVTHHWPLHTRAVPAPLRLVTRHALLTYAIKHWPRWQAALLGGIVWLEAYSRGLVARTRGEASSAACYRRLRSLVGDVLRGRDASVCRAIHYAARFLAPIAAAQDSAKE
jgi:N-acetylglucosaminyl-diphospho-decaprenol L-rhamnosyltransferase